MPASLDELLARYDKLIEVLSDEKTAQAKARRELLVAYRRLVGDSAPLWIYAAEHTPLDNGQHLEAAVENMVGGRLAR